MGARIAKAIIGCTVKQPDKVVETGINVLSQMYENPAEYTTPPRTKIIFSGIVDDAAASQAASKNRGKLEIATRDTDVGTLFTVLEDEYVPYVNGLYKGNRVKLLLSGLPVTTDSSPVGLPDAPVIDHINDGPDPHSAKIFLKRSKGGAKKKKGNLTYNVYQSSDPAMAASSFKLVLTVTSMNKLVVGGLTRAVEVAFAVSCRNSAGSTDMSAPVKFLPK